LLEAVRDILGDDAERGLFHHSCSKCFQHVAVRAGAW
jgi:hypothetical protein